MTAFDCIIKELSQLKDNAYNQDHYMSGCAYKDAIRIVRKYKRIVERKHHEKEKEAENRISKVGKHNAETSEQG